MATVATVYAVEEHHRTPEQIMNLENGPAEARPKPVTKRVWASVEREPEAIAKEVFDEAESRDPQRQRNWALLVDGHVHQLERVGPDNRTRLGRRGHSNCVLRTHTSNSRFYPCLGIPLESSVLLLRGGKR
ncbi:MAG: hypothetical protein K2X93_05930, partial [Candidatus Obscuribacterales bacterium]|nr:hypothetical protein [Candidatus Obscuribacterales bacterium]